MWSAASKNPPRAGDTVAIIGLGPIGLMFVKLAKLYGCRVIAVGRRQTQLDRAAALGADDLIVAGEHSDPVKSSREMTHGRGVDVAIEAVGKPQTWQWAVNMVRRGGTVNFFGGCPNESKVNLDTALLHYSEITCKASFHHTPAYIRKALELVCAGHITAKVFVNKEEPLANLLEVMRHLMSHNGHLKTAIVP
ncbi:MAG: zinc-binding dehydrogenase [Ignavibacteriota bacterium]